MIDFNDMCTCLNKYLVWLSKSECYLLQLNSGCLYITIGTV